MAGNITISTEMFLNDILHDNPIQCDVSSRQYLLIDQLRSHKVIECILTFRFYLRQYTLICMLSKFVDIINMFTHRLQIRIRYFRFEWLLLLLRDVRFTFFTILAKFLYFLHFLSSLCFLYSFWALLTHIRIVEIFVNLYLFLSH
jgi:hypothetical protein